jgi:hypothetical protein
MRKIIWWLGNITRRRRSEAEHFHTNRFKTLAALLPFGVLLPIAVLVFPSVRMSLDTEPRIWFYVGSNFAIAGVFFTFWLRSSIRQETIAMAIYACVQAFYQLQFLSAVRSFQSPERIFLLTNVLAWYEASFGMLVGISFSRSRFSVLRYSLPFLLITPWLSPLIYDFPELRQITSHAVVFFWVPLMYGGGALLCLIQAAFLHLQPKAVMQDLRARIRRLNLMGALLTGFAVLHFIQAKRIGIATVDVMIFHVTHMALMIHLGRLIALDGHRTPEAPKKTQDSEPEQRAA